MADGAEVFSFIAAAETLAGVFEQDEVMLFTDSEEWVEVGHGAAHVDGHDTFRAGGYGAADRFGIEGQRFVDVYQNRDGANAEDAFEAGDKGEYGHDDLIPGADPEGGVGSREGGRAAGDELGMVDAELIADRFLKLF